MGLKVWSLVLAIVIIVSLLIGFRIGVVSLLDLGMLIFVTLVLLAAYLTLTRNTLTKVPTPLEIEKMKRKKQNKNLPGKKI